MDDKLTLQMRKTKRNKNCFVQGQKNMIVYT